MPRARLTLTLLIGAALALTATLMSTAPAARARAIHTVLQDDKLSLFSPAELPGFTHTLRWLGVDELRITAEWKLEAPDPDAGREPKRFAAGDPRSYDSSVGMLTLDRAVRAAAAAGLGVMLDPAFSAPRWATRNPLPADPNGGTLYNDGIDVRDAATWESMLARRYNGRYTPRGSRTPLPRVGTFTLWNEPNQTGFLRPQYSAAGTPLSADWTRALTDAAYPAIKRADPGATVLIGNTSSTGDAPQAGNSGVPPLTFIRQLACVNAQLEPIATGSCAHFRTVPADGYAQHTYEYRSPPWTPSGGAGDAGIGDLARLQSLLDRLVMRHRLAAGAADLWITEQGYESNGQLSTEPWTEPQQAELNADAEYVAWRDGQSASFAQFLLRDTLVRETLALRGTTGNPRAAVGGTWSTGLEREDGQAKPALAMFRTPVAARFVSYAPIADWLFASPPGRPAEIAEVWGRARPMHTPTLVIVDASAGGGPWRTVAESVTDGNGIFDVHVPVAALVPVAVRFRWLDAEGRWESSPATSPVLMSG